MFANLFMTSSLYNVKFTAETVYCTYIYMVYFSKYVEHKLDLYIMNKGFCNYVHHGILILCEYAFTYANKIDLCTLTSTLL